MNNERPPDIDASVKAGNTAHLSNAGRKGALAMHEKRGREKSIAEIEAELKEEEANLAEWERKVSSNEHIIDPDGNDQDFFKH